MNALIYWPVLISVVLADFITKAIAEATLSPSGVPQQVAGDVLRWTLVYNRGAAFGLSLGSFSRWIFLTLSVVALVILRRMYTQTVDGDVPRALAVSLVSAGAIGNLIDRVRHEYGVVDFIDVGIGASRWPTFNIADMAVSVGAVLLAWVLWNEEPATGAMPESTSASDQSA